ncbi:vesicle coat protein [Clohesyomyces aquaticus]|uniref:Vesicle coat protein n=1 Tax=Clohesyomyces aquaticus TaxID=1231657 RepID=A0A1Y1ZHV8_9PLEO|nr:vesicle coat protein [Clohesyomyces aquaticus]
MAGHLDEADEADEALERWSSIGSDATINAHQTQVLGPVLALSSISLAHFCELHGPTSIICTQASTSPCTTCNPCVTPPTDDVLHSSYSYNGLYEQPSVKLSGRLPQLSSPFETPPTSPRSPTHNPYFPSFSSASDFGSRRPSSSFDSDPDVCENCQFIVPKACTDRLPAGAPGSPSKDGRGRNGSPVLRTTQTFTIRGASVGCDDLSSSSDSSDTEQSRSYDSAPSSFPDSVPESPMFMSRATHTHTLNYISTRQPQLPETYSLLRRTCIRALSCENLPLGKPSGPLFFGDPVVGYTIAYVFRLQDPRARGQKRTYALIAMAGRDCRRATRALVKVTEVFEAIANMIIALAEKVLERESAASAQASSRPQTAIPSTPPLGSSAQSMPAFLSPQKKESFSSVASSPTSRNITPVSSFLSAKRVDPDGYPRVSRDVMRAKSLIEIVGKEDFFVNLHAMFCSLLHSLIKEFGA